MNLALLQIDIVLLRGGDFGDWTTIIAGLYHATVGMALISKPVQLAISAIAVYALKKRVFDATSSIISFTTAISIIGVINGFFVLVTPSYLASIELYLVVWSLTIVSMIVIIIEGISISNQMSS